MPHRDFFISKKGRKWAFFTLSIKEYVSEANLFSPAATFCCQIPRGKKFDYVSPEPKKPGEPGLSALNHETTFHFGIRVWNSEGSFFDRKICETVGAVRRDHFGEYNIINATCYCNLRQIKNLRYPIIIWKQKMRKYLFKPIKKYWFYNFILIY